jgi:glycosyltransferase involved in cell wall biosynthesis
MKPILSVIIPVFNEEATLESVVRRVLEQVPYDLEVVIINDGSTDRSGEIIEELAREDRRVRFAHQQNGGKTAALKQGFGMAAGEVIIIQDADLEYDPAEIVHVVEPILKGHADVVYGSRFLVRKAARVLFYYHYVANRFLTFLSNMMTNLNMTDVETGYKAFRAQIIQNMVIQSSGFGIEIEVTAKVAKLNAVIYEVPISYYGRTYLEGKKIGMRDGFLAIWYIFRFNAFCSLAQSFTVIPEKRSLKSYSYTSMPARRV